MGRAEDKASHSWRAANGVEGHGQHPLVGTIGHVTLRKQINKAAKWLACSI